MQHFLLDKLKKITFLLYDHFLINFLRWTWRRIFCCYVRENFWGSPVWFFFWHGLGTLILFLMVAFSGWWSLVDLGIVMSPGPWIPGWEGNQVICVYAMWHVFLYIQWPFVFMTWFRAPYLPNRPPTWSRDDRDHMINRMQSDFGKL